MTKEQCALVVAELRGLQCIAAGGIALYAFDHAHFVLGTLALVVAALNFFGALQAEGG